MGSNTSKPHQEPVQQSWMEIETGDTSDPRSPTPEIVRTPLQGKGGSKHNITKNVDLRKTFENAKEDGKLIHNNPILSAVIKNHLQSYDPRSPTQDFERTPIVIMAKDEKQSRLHEDSCDSPIFRDDNGIDLDFCEEVSKNTDSIVPKNLCNEFYDLSLNGTIKESEEPLGSSTASNEAIENNISPNHVEKTAKLLETNFDFCENESNDKFEDSVENIIKVDSMSDNDVKNIPLFKILNDDPRSPSVGIERTPIVVAKTNEKTAISNVEDMSDDSLIKVLQNTNVELRQTGTKPHDNNTDGLLIYEDEAPSLNDTPKKSKSSSNSGSRTPLSCMKNKTETGHSRSKSANTLFDPKNQNIIQQKLAKRTSHIPRLKSLSKQTKVITTGSTISLKNISRVSVIGGDCENTPPHSHRDRWDKDNSIVL
ncbi:unnamed protein product [Diatraea saccharalis]|uniref:Uncharacterized protein n=1 Tax=Diatraea saccharalis TaxID=40085 RepID=A0A9N9WIL2_9NEOP|nr:unnamed protein product [Diatraea saccharalis]